MRAGTIALLVLATSRAAAQLPQLKEQPLPSALAELLFMADTTVGIVVHPSGCLLMADPGESQVVCTDMRSGATKRIGRGGAGPGEFGSIMGIAVVPGGSLVVQDLRHNRLTFVKPDWTAGGSVPLETRMLPGLYRPTRDSVFGLSDMPRLELLAVSLRTGGATKSASPGKADSALFALPHYRIWGFFMQPSGSSGWLVASIGHHAVLRLDASGRIAARAQRDLPPELPSAEEREARKALVARFNPNMTAEQARGIQARVDEYSKAPKATTVKHGFLEDASGRLWVVTSRVRADSTEIDVYETNGKYLGTRRVPGRVQAFTRMGNELLVLGEYLAGPLTGSQGVRRYRME